MEHSIEQIINMINVVIFISKLLVKHMHFIVLELEEEILNCAMLLILI